MLLTLLTCGPSMQSRLIVAQGSHKHERMTTPTFAIDRVYCHTVRGSRFQICYGEIGYHSVGNIVHYVVSAVSYFGYKLLGQAAVKSLHTADFQPCMATFCRGAIVWSVGFSCRILYNQYYSTSNKYITISIIYFKIISTFKNWSDLNKLSV